MPCAREGRRPKEALLNSEAPIAEPLATLLVANRRYAAEQHNAEVPAPPALRLAVLTCMDARIVALHTLGLRTGDAHILRNAGGRVTDDVLRSLAVSCAVYETADFAIVQHTDCGMLQPEAQLRARIESATGHAPETDLRVILDPDRALEEDVERVRTSSLVPRALRVWGLQYDITTGLLSLRYPA